MRLHGTVGLGHPAQSLAHRPRSLHGGSDGELGNTGWAGAPPLLGQVPAAFRGSSFFSRPFLGLRALFLALTPPLPTSPDWRPKCRGGVSRFRGWGENHLQVHGELDIGAWLGLPLGQPKVRRRLLTQPGPEFQAPDQCSVHFSTRKRTKVKDLGLSCPS